MEFGALLIRVGILCLKLFFCKCMSYSTYMNVSVATSVVGMNVAVCK